MKAVQYSAYGEPSVVLSECRVSDPPAPTGDQVLIRVSKRPVHPGDLLGVRGRYRAQGDMSPGPRAAVTPGFEGVGVVAAVGPGVIDSPHLQPGRRVAFFPGPGAWGEWVLASAQHVVSVPDDIPDTIASQLFVTPMTAIMLVRAALEAGLNDKGAMVINAAGSNVARLVATLALRRGLHVVGIVRRAEAVPSLRERVPGLQVVSTESPEWLESARQAVSGRPVRAVLDPVGGAEAIELIGLLADGGTYVSFGNLSGQSTPINSLLLPVRDLVLRGVSVGRWAALPAAQRAEDVRTAIELMRLAPDQFRVAREYPLSEVTDAVRFAEMPARAGTVLLTS